MLERGGSLGGESLPENSQTLNRHFFGLFCLGLGCLLWFLFVLVLALKKNMALVMHNKESSKHMDASKYVRYTPEQVEALERVYMECPKPSSLRRQQLIRECPILSNIEPKQIKVWFQNRRWGILSCSVMFKTTTTLTLTLSKDIQSECICWMQFLAYPFCLYLNICTATQIWFFFWCGSFGKSFFFCLLFHSKSWYLFISFFLQLLFSSHILWFSEFLVVILHFFPFCYMVKWTGVCIFLYLVNWLIG